MKRYKKMNNKLVDWVDTWFGGSLAGYRVSYSIVRPHILLRHLYLEIKWACQRVYRGWDDRVVWSIDFWLNRNLPDILLELKETKHGTPLSFFKGDNTDEDEENAKNLWDAELDKMIEGFTAGRRIDNFDYENDEEEKVLNDLFDRGMKSFVKYYRNLWD